MLYNRPPSLIVVQSSKFSEDTIVANRGTEGSYVVVGERREMVRTTYVREREREERKRRFG